jgi:hypothetical protein
MRRVLALTLLLALLAPAVHAQDVMIPSLPAAGQPGAPPMMVPPVPPPGYTPVPRGDPLEPNPLDRRLTSPFARPTEAGGQAARTFNENFDGDFAGVFYKQLLTVRERRTIFAQRVVGFTPVTTTTTSQVVGQDQLGRPTIITTVTNNTVNNPIIANVPVATEVVVSQRLARLTLAARYSGILITDNDNPRPQDRVYAGFNFYDDIGRGLNPNLGEVDLQRQMAGFEKTFLDGDASFGMRLPFVQQYGPPGVSGTNNVGDLTLIWKYALLNNRETGNLWSAGLVLTTPTGSGDAILWDGRLAPHSVLFQPWTGFVRTFDRGYVQGITSFVIPTDSRDPTLWNNSVAAGFYVYRNPDSWLTAVVPTAEIHLRTPLSNSNPAGLVYLQDQLNLTGGVHLRFNRAVLSGAVCVPVMGPRPWALEAMSFLNIPF